jgi:hypothetical protein
MKSVSTLLLHIGICALVSSQEVNYPWDHSFPIYWPEDKLLDGPLGSAASRREFYQEFMQGCREHEGIKANRCDLNERDRLAMTRRQAVSMVNYTDVGFKKIRAPKRVRELLFDYWNKNKVNKKQEVWGTGNTYANHWKAPSYMVSVEDGGLRGGGRRLKEEIWDAAKSTIEEWTGMELKPTSMYGIRMYTEGAILNPHVDRLPLVSSCIVNVAQDVDEPWPLEVYDRQGNAVNVTMEPGDMVLYESGSLIHGRPFPLKGRYFANIFIHFEPTGRRLSDTTDDYLDEIDDFYPPYLLPGSPELETWKMRNPHGWRVPSPAAALAAFKPEAHAAAAIGDVDSIKRLAKTNKNALLKTDSNGWQPIHEAARGGHVEVIALLLQHDADINARTHGGKGGSPLNVAIESLSAKHPVARFLLENGAENIEPEL